MRYYKIAQASFNDPDRLSILEALTRKYTDLSDESNSQKSDSHTPTNPVLSKDFGCQNMPIDINSRDVLATEIEPLEPLPNIEISQPPATEIEVNAESRFVPVVPEVGPISWGGGLRAVEILTRTGDWLRGYFYLGRRDKRHRIADSGGYRGIFVDENEFRFVDGVAV